MQKPITTRTHGILDYATALLLILLPHLLGLENGDPAAVMPTILGIGILVYSLATRYEMGVFPLLGMKAHLVLDVAGAIVLALSPWICGFAERIYLPHVLIGLLELSVVALTSPLLQGNAKRAPF